MFPSSSPTFSKLKCPRLDSCTFGPEICLFSHDKAVYLKGGVDGKIGLSSMTYYKDLQQRMRSEEAACKSSELFETKSDESKDKLGKAMEHDLSNFIHRAPVGCKISANLREKVLLKLIKAMRQIDAGSTLSQAAIAENELLLRSGGTVSSVYLSSVSDYIKKMEKRGDHNSSYPVIANDHISYEDLRGIVANTDSLNEYSYPLPCEIESKSSILVGCFDAVKSCRRCGINFIPSKYYNSSWVGEKSCRYHSGKVEKVNGLRVYGCCHAPVGDSHGCETGKWHVFEGYKQGGPTPRFSPLTNESNSNLKNIIALDAEMFYTVGGYEVSRLTLVDFHTEATLLDVLIEPRYVPVLDYNTKWSGVSAKLYESGEYEVIKFDEMKRKLSEFIGKETILIGHSLDNDLKILEFSHNLIVDTAILYPHQARPPYRMSLKSLALGHLSELVQQSVEGHDSKEDCTTCIRLVKKYFKTSFKGT